MVTSKQAGKAKPRPAKKTKTSTSLYAAVPKKACNFCGGLDHQRKSNRLCPYHKDNVLGSIQQPTKRIPERPRPPSHLGIIAVAKAKIARIVAFTQGKEPPQQCSSKITDTGVPTTNFIKLTNAPNAPAYKPVIDVASPDFKPTKTIFKVLHVDARGRKVELVPTAAVLMNRFFSEHLIEHIVKCSNKYRSKRMREFPELKFWEDKIQSAKFTSPCVLHFLALLYYFGIVKLPSKRDYWSTHAVMPRHTITDNMPFRRFVFLWRHFHLKEEFEDEELADMGEDESEENEDE